MSRDFLAEEIALGRRVGLKVLPPGLDTLAVSPDGRGFGFSWHRATSDLYLG